MSNQSKPLMVVLSSPSGAGKTTLSKKIQQSDNSFKISVSHTTRKPRANEVDGVDYYFVSEKKFKSLLDEKAFYEHSKIFENYYGTSKSSVNEILKNNCNVLFDIDWKGVEQLRKFKELNLVTIFILPPSKEELKKKYLNYIDDINQNSVVKNIFQKKDQNQQVELLNEILKELNEIKFSKKIDKLENKLMKEFDEKSYSDLIQLKSQINKE